MKSRTTPFHQLLSRANSLDELRPLLGALGFGGEWTHCGRELWPPSLSDCSDLIAGLVMAGERSGLLALVIQLHELTAAQAARIARRLRSENPARLCFFVFCDGGMGQLALASFGASEDFRVLLLERGRLHPTDLEALRELVPADHEGGLMLSLRHARVLDRSRVTRRFFVDFKAQRGAVADAWRGLRNADDDRRQLALLMLCRLVFLYFLQKRGHLAGDAEYLYSLWCSWRRRRHKQSFYCARLKPLFFGVLNTRPELRTGGAKQFGGLPYLNGGLFERHALERRHRKLDLPDRVLGSVFDNLLQRYRFTTHDSAQAPLTRTVDAGVDPEMLGRVFEELMAESQRGDTGTFFTPPAVVDRLVSAGLEAWLAARPSGRAAALRQVRVLDPACGSGAFLLGALARIADARSAADGPDADRCRREIVEHVLHGVDLQSDAALLCALRLWLTLLPAPSAKAVQPLPNLDRRIRQGDALVDPLDFALSSERPNDSTAIPASPELRAALKRLRAAAARYLDAEPTDRDQLRVELQQLELRVAEAWIVAGRCALERAQRELRAQQAEMDLFGERTARAQAAERELTQISARNERLLTLERELSDQQALPFFSFPVHYADSAADGFDLIVSNPPWVRAHRWPPSIGRALRDRYEVCRNAGWKAANSGTGVPAAQVDLSLLFLERSLRLLKPDGALALLLPAKVFRSLYAGGARALLLRETRVTRLEDHSLDQHSIFRADAFAAAVVAVRAPAAEGHVRVTSYRRSVPVLEFDVALQNLSLVPGDPASPWLLVPPAAAQALRKMQMRGPMLSEWRGLRARRGVFTGANDVLIIDDVRPKLGDHAWIRAEGYTRTPEGESRTRYRALIEESVLRPVVRGAELRAWRHAVHASLIWTYDPGCRPQPLPARTTRYLHRHERRLCARSAWRPGSPLGCVFGVAPHTTQAKVAWRDLAPTLEAVLLPARIRSHGRVRELIPLNTVYYVSAATDVEGLVLCAYLNSLPVRTFARAIAERAKDAHFRFFAWTIGCLPLPRCWQANPLANRLSALARQSHERGGIAPEDQLELDRLVADAYGLTAADRTALEQYDAWLRGQS